MPRRSSTEARNFVGIGSDCCASGKIENHISILPLFSLLHLCDSRGDLMSQSHLVACCKDEPVRAYLANCPDASENSFVANELSQQATRTVPAFFHSDSPGHEQGPLEIMDRSRSKNPKVALSTHGRRSPSSSVE